MAAGGGSSKSKEPKPRKRVEAETTNNSNTLLRAKDEAKKKPVERNKSASDEPKPKRLREAKDEQKSSTSNKPKRPLTAFFIFMDDFRKTFKQENPLSNVKDLAKQGGIKWKSLTEEEKKVYTDKAAQLKAEYNKSLESNDADEEEEDEEKEKQADDAEVTRKKATNIFFETIVQDRKCELLVPAPLVREYCLKFQGYVDYIDNVGTFKARMGGWKDRVTIKGWNSICRRNGLVTGDRVSCEIFRMGDLVHAIKIHIDEDQRALGTLEVMVV